MNKLKSTTNSAKITNLQKEQTLLMNVQTELTSILKLVNESINELKVEQLQLKSHEISCATSKPNMTTVPGKQVALWTSSSALAKCNDEIETDNNHENKYEINKQKIILDALPISKRKHYEVEEEDEDMD